MLPIPPFRGIISTTIEKLTSQVVFSPDFWTINSTTTIPESPKYGNGFGKLTWEPFKKQGSPFLRRQKDDKTTARLKFTWGLGQDGAWAVGIWELITWHESTVLVWWVQKSQANHLGYFWNPMKNGIFCFIDWCRISEPSTVWWLFRKTPFFDGFLWVCWWWTSGRWLLWDLSTQLISIWVWWSPISEVTDSCGIKAHRIEEEDLVNARKVIW